MAKITVFAKDGTKAKDLEVSDEIFAARINERLLELVARLYANNKRTGTAHTKTRAEVRGGGKKPWRQKGTGRARVSSIRSPLWRGGGTVFGPRKRDIYNTVPKKVRRKALMNALSKKFKDGHIIVVDDLQLASHKTKELFSVVENLKLENRKTLWVVNELNNNERLASRNIDKLSTQRTGDVNAYHILRKNYILLDVNTLQSLEKRILEGSQPEEVAVAN